MKEKVIVQVAVLNICELEVLGWSLFMRMNHVLGPINTMCKTIWWITNMYWVGFLVVLHIVFEWVPFAIFIFIILDSKGPKI